MSPSPPSCPLSLIIPLVPTHFQYYYFCDVPGHCQAGMYGSLTVTAAGGAATSAAATSGAKNSSASAAASASGSAASNVTSTGTTVPPSGTAPAGSSPTSGAERVVLNGLVLVAGIAALLA